MANVELSNEEWKVLSNASFLLTKNDVMGKMMQAFSYLATEYQKMVAESTSNWKQYITISPKISRGEQYEGLPYLMLDFPREFGQKNIFAIRSFFWWGHHFSISLLATGTFQHHLEAMIPNLKLNDWYLDQSETPWNHHPDRKQSLLLNSVEIKHRKPRPFLKLFRQLPLNQWQSMETFFLSSFRELWYAISFQDGETDLLPDDPTSKNRP